MATEQPNYQQAFTACSGWWGIYKNMSNLKNNQIPRWKVFYDHDEAVKSLMNLRRWDFESHADYSTEYLCDSSFVFYIKLMLMNYYSFYSLGNLKPNKADAHKFVYNFNFMYWSETHNKGYQSYILKKDPIEQLPPEAIAELDAIVYLDALYDELDAIVKKIKENIVKNTKETFLETCELWDKVREQFCKFPT